MSTIAHRLSTGSIALVMLFGFVAPAAADVNIRGRKTAELNISADKPSRNQLERQFGAYWNPNIPLNAKLQVTYKGNTAKVKNTLKKVLSYSHAYDFLSIKGRAVGSIRINGNRMSVAVEGVMAGFPAQRTRYHWIRENNLWKFDLKKLCQEMKCQDNPDFGY